MGKRRKKKLSSTLTWKATQGFFRLVSQGIVKGSPLLLFGAIGFGIFWGIRQNLYADPGFLVRTVEVLPENSLSDADLQTLESRYLNQNLFRVPIGTISESIEQNPRIREARVTRKFPKTLLIEISERVPFGQIRYEPKGPYYTVSEDGVILEKTTARDGNLLQMEVFDGKPTLPKLGEAIRLAGFKEGVRVVKAFWQHPLAQTERVGQVRLNHLGDVALVLQGGPELRFGRRPMQKFPALNSIIGLLKGPERERIIYIDLEYQDLVVRKK